MANEMNWVNHSGVLTNEDLNKSFQRVAQPLFRFRQFVKFKEAFGKHKGQSQNWLKVSNASDFGGTLVETNTMHETTQALVWGTVTVNEYGLSIPMTFKVQALSEFDVKQIIRESLMDDMVKVIDGSVEREFNKTLLRYTGLTASTSSITTNGTVTDTNTSTLNSFHLRKMALQLKTRNVPGFTGLGGSYVAILSHEAHESLVGALESTNQYTTQGYEKILNGEVGKWNDIRIVSDGFASRLNYDASARTADTTVDVGSSAAGSNWGGGLSGGGYVFGSPTVREIVAVPEEIRAKVVTDYGRSHGLGWYGIFGWKIEWDTSGGANSRIIKWDSAA